MISCKSPSDFEGWGFVSTYGVAIGYDEIGPSARKKVSFGKDNQWNLRILREDVSVSSLSKRLAASGPFLPLCLPGARRGLRCSQEILCFANKANKKEEKEMKRYTRRGL